ncbi:MAG: hypothetical protein FD153_34 [Rhodospirillaceae bacterium]|nr:MAG: hypothetical protein FD153_34 [Rhodospirillaceae bacterium]
MSDPYSPYAVDNFVQQHQAEQERLGHASSLLGEGGARTIEEVGFAVGGLVAMIACAPLGFFGSIACLALYGLVQEAIENPAGFLESIDAIGETLGKLRYPGAAMPTANKDGDDILYSFSGNNVRYRCPHHGPALLVGGPGSKIFILSEQCRAVIVDFVEGKDTITVDPLIWEPRRVQWAHPFGEEWDILGVKIYPGIPIVAQPDDIIYSESRGDGQYQEMPAREVELIFDGAHTHVMVLYGGGWVNIAVLWHTRVRSPARVFPRHGNSRFNPYTCTDRADLKGMVDNLRPLVEKPAVWKLSVLGLVKRLKESVSVESVAEDGSPDEVVVRIHHNHDSDLESVVEVVEVLTMNDQVAANFLLNERWQFKRKTIDAILSDVDLSTEDKDAIATLDTDKLVEYALARRRRLAAGKIRERIDQFPEQDRANLLSLSDDKLVEWYAKWSLREREALAARLRSDLSRFPIEDHTWITKMNTCQLPEYYGEWARKKRAELVAIIRRNAASLPPETRDQIAAMSDDRLLEYARGGEESKSA